MTTIAAPVPKLTPDDLLRLPFSNTLELVAGSFLGKDVSTLSSRTELTVAKKLIIFADESGVAAVFPGTLGFQCFPDDPDKIRKPDCTVIRTERLRDLPNPNPGFMPIVPDLAVEVVSTNDTLHEIDEKVTEYMDAGFPLIWVVDPILRQTFIYSSTGKACLLSGDEQITCESALPGFSCRVSELFPART